MRSGKTYYQIAQVVADARGKAADTPVIWASPTIANRVQEVADMIGVKVDIKTADNKWRAYFQQDHRWEHLGFYDSKEEAKEAYLHRLNNQNIRNIYAK